MIFHRFLYVYQRGNLNKPVEPVRNQVVAAAITWGFSWWFNVIICYVLHQKWWKIYDLSRFSCGKLTHYIHMNCRKVWKAIGFGWFSLELSINLIDEMKKQLLSNKNGMKPWAYLGILGDGWIQEYCYERGECVRITYIYR